MFEGPEDGITEALGTVALRLVGPGDNVGETSWPDGLVDGTRDVVVGAIWGMMTVTLS